MKQYLLNEDGSLRDGADLAALLREGIPLVMPTPMPRESGMVAVERPPVQDVNGIWRQVWELHPIPVVEEEQLLTASEGHQ